MEKTYLVTRLKPFKKLKIKKRIVNFIWSMHDF